jgi:interleukin-1 receptor-associated kinase 1
MMEALQVITKLLPPPYVPLEKPRFMWPPEDESSSLSPYLTTANTSLESSLTILVEMAGRRQVSSENTGSSLHHRPMAMIGEHSQEQEDVSVYHTTRL